MSHSFSTWTEAILNMVGLLAAIASGVAQVRGTPPSSSRRNRFHGNRQPLMTLIFGNLVQTFLTFVNVIARAKAGDESAIQSLPHVASDFRREAGLNAVYLVGIGSMSFTFFLVDVRIDCYQVVVFLSAPLFGCRFGFTLVR